MSFCRHLPLYCKLLFSWISGDQVFWVVLFYWHRAIYHLDSSCFGVTNQSKKNLKHMVNFPHMLGLSIKFIVNTALCHLNYTNKHLLYFILYYSNTGQLYLKRCILSFRDMLPIIYIQYLEVNMTYMSKEILLVFTFLITLSFSTQVHIKNMLRYVVWSMLNFAISSLFQEYLL